MRPRLLDLFCGAGGCSVGYHRAGFDVVGVDNRLQPHYPYEFVQADALTFPLDGFDAIHASPPCQSESDLRWRTGVDYLDLITPMLSTLVDSGLPWVVENVESSQKLPGSLVLCGAGFGLGALCKDGVWRPLRRHRRFLSSVPLMGPGCACDGRQPLGVYGTGGGGQMTRGYKGTLTESVAALGVPWMNRAEVSQAIPPSYTEFIGAQLLAHLAVAA